MAFVVSLLCSSDCPPSADTLDISGEPSSQLTHSSSKRVRTKKRSDAYFALRDVALDSSLVGAPIDPGRHADADVFTPSPQAQTKSNVAMLHRL